jgi:hypothetical protein
VKNVTNPKCGDCAKFQKYHETKTSTGHYRSACMLDIDIPKHIPEKQKDKYIKEFIKKSGKKGICEDFIEDNE